MLAKGDPNNQRWKRRSTTIWWHSACPSTMNMLNVLGVGHLTSSIRLTNVYPITSPFLMTQWPFMQSIVGFTALLDVGSVETKRFSWLKHIFCWVSQLSSPFGLDIAINSAKVLHVQTIPVTIHHNSTGWCTGISWFISPSKYNWLVVYLTLWQIWVRQLGRWHSQYMERHKIPWFQSPPTR